MATPADISRLQKARRKIHVSGAVKEYITSIVGATRINPLLRLGSSPRGSLGLMRSGQALAALRGREYVLPDDIKSLAVPVLSHRMILREEERLRNTSQEDIVNQILNKISVPVSEK